jgi:hypothetical protein
LTPERRRLIAIVVFALDAVLCGFWAYREVNPVVDPSSGSGGIAGVSFGIVGMLVTIVPPIVTMVLASLTGSRLAKWWRNAHLVATFAFIIVPMAMTNLYVLIVSIVVFPPMTVFFVIGAVAIWIASPRTHALTPES